MAYDQQVKQTINSMDVVPVINAAPQANTTGNITTSSTSITATDLTGIGSATVQISGTHAGINMIFEASADGTTFFPIQGQNQSTGVLTTAGATGVIPSNTTVVWTVSPLLGQSQFRVRSTAFTSGSGAIVIHPSTQFVALPLATQTISGAVTTTGTVTVSANAGAFTAGGNSVLKAEDAAHASGDLGIEMLAVRNDNAATVLTSATGDYSPVATDSVGAMYNRPAPSTTATTPASVSASVTSVQILASNPAARLRTLNNISASDCYVKFGTAASTTSFNIFIPSNGSAAFNGEDYSGVVHAIWNTAVGAMIVGETQL